MVAFGIWGIAYQGYAYNYPSSVAGPNAAAFPPMYPFLIKVFSLNQPTLMPWVEVLISNAFSFIALYFLYTLVPFIVNEKYRLRVCFAFIVFPTLLVAISYHTQSPSFSPLRSARTITGSVKSLHTRGCSRYSPFLRAKSVHSSSSFLLSTCSTVTFHIVSDRAISGDLSPLRSPARALGCFTSSTSTASGTRSLF